MPIGATPGTFDTRDFLKEKFAWIRAQEQQQNKDEDEETEWKEGTWSETTQEVRKGNKGWRDRRSDEG